MRQQAALTLKMRVYEDIKRHLNKKGRNFTIAMFYRAIDTDNSRGVDP